jgi:hypothetical protein
MLCFIKLGKVDQPQLEELQARRASEVVGVLHLSNDAIVRYVPAERACQVAVG